ncbi:putative bifunctional diguanylate cyclase/phosphodiesterase [Skermania piniformis]|uniref:EAL domain-containing protein n=1 Tax=Skermania pinensis TaxID=39122 RepID=A0ABX8SB85_9ACTN|nr:EAL domain-containing protein [Skermania piniformis]QXQ15123.1 EAL domain-containing protein [Skermania piniformis]
MFGRILQSRVVARLAIVGLTVGLALLAAVALWATRTTSQTSDAVRRMDSIGNHWTHVILHVNTEYEALTDYLIANRSISLQPLRSAVDSAGDDLDWLRRNGNDRDRAEADIVAGAYASYTKSVRQLLAAGAAGDDNQVRLKAAEAGLGASSVRKQAVSNASRKHYDLTELIDRAVQRNARLRNAETGLVAIDLALLALSGLILVNYQRRIERQAVRDRHRARHDGLTGTANRTRLLEKLEDAIESTSPGALLMLDLDRFKEVNDTLGHHHGDLLLREVAHRLLGAVGSNDLVARLGGDEFAVLLPSTENADQAMTSAARIREALNRPADLEGMEVPVEASIGAAVFPDHGDTADLVMRYADIAMYTAKREKLGVACYRPGDGESLSGRMTLLSELRRAIPRNELVLRYQPKVRLGTGEFVGVEVLVRWQHPQRGLLPPSEFLPVAEHADVIWPLNEWVLRSALAQCEAWRSAGYHCPIAVNIPGSMLVDDLVDRVTVFLREFSCPPGVLSLEVTEGDVIQDTDRAAAVMARLRTAGVLTSIDDFGTGYSSMSRLMVLPLDELKIDREFTEAAITRNGAAIVAATIQLGHTVGLRVVAEGIEDSATMIALTELGCDEAQGYYISPPLDRDQLATWLARYVDSKRRTAVPSAPG